MNVYDFDKTIYNGDSTVDFYFFCLRKDPRILRYIFRQAHAVLMNKAGKYDTTKMKEIFFCFLSGMKQPEAAVEEFWDKHQKRIRNWYMKDRRDDDLVISASPEFLIAPICRRLQIRAPIATEADIATGKIRGRNCKGEEKVRLFRANFPEGTIDKFYSDSRSDAPLAEIAQEAYLVDHDTIMPW